MTGDARELTHVVLRSGVPPSVDAREHRCGPDAENRAELARRNLDKVIVVEIHRVRIGDAADERANQQRSPAGARLPTSTTPTCRR